jgi:hypothetical protein
MVTVASVLPPGLVRRISHVDDNNCFICEYHNGLQKLHKVLVSTIINRVCVDILHIDDILQQFQINRVR